MNHRRCPVSLLLFAVVALSSFGCSTWRSQNAPLGQVVTEKPRAVYRVWVAGANVPIEIRAVRIAADTLRGWGGYARIPGRNVSPSDWDWRYPARSKPDSVAIPLSAIHRVEARRFSAGKTLLHVAAVGSIAAIVTILTFKNWDMGL